MAGTCEFELFKDSAGQFRWRLRSANGLIIATGGEGHTSKASAQSGIYAVKACAATAKVEDIT